ncbi:MAG: C4-type zinc ribbon domain-containing protein [Planctomycetota bacterium]
MKDIIKHLKLLNELDIRLVTTKKDIERLPKELSEKQIQLKILNDSIERVKSEIVRLKMEANSLELEITSGEEMLKRYAKQMNILRTSKEFEAIKRQMDAQRVWNKETEGKALEFLEQIDVKQKDVELNRVTIAAVETELAAETARVEKEVAELQAEHDKLYKDREALTKAVPEKELMLYNRIASRGQAIASVERGICSVCCMRLPPQVQNLAILANDLAFCPSCGRILMAS